MKHLLRCLHGVYIDAPARSPYIINIWAVFRTVVARPIYDNVMTFDLITAIETLQKNLYFHRRVVVVVMVRIVVIIIIIIIITNRHPVEIL